MIGKLADIALLEQINLLFFLASLIENLSTCKLVIIEANLCEIHTSFGEISLKIFTQ